MNAVLLDTHVWAWTLAGHDRLSRPALAAIAAADLVLISPITFFEIAQKVRLGKWPEMTPYIGGLAGLLDRQGGALASCNPEICTDAGLMPWTHRDPFDRLLAATAMHHNLPLISADTVFDGVIHRIW